MVAQINIQIQNGHLKNQLKYSDVLFIYLFFTLLIKHRPTSRVLFPRYLMETNGNIRTLTINKTTLADDAAYECVIGEDKCFTEVFVKGTSDLPRRRPGLKRQSAVGS